MPGSPPLAYGAGAAYLFLLPTIVGLLLFSAGPIIASAYLSFTRWDLLSAPRWLGLNNYIALFHDPTFWVCVRNTLYYSSDVGTYDTGDPPALVVSGTISPQGVVTFAPNYQVGINRPIDVPVTEDDLNAIYTLQGYDASGNTLFVHNFQGAKLDVHNANYGHTFTFQEPVPVVST